MDYKQKKIVTKLNKVEKVELGNMSAIKGALSILKGFEPKAYKEVEKYDKIFKEYDAQHDRIVKVRNEIYNFVEREAKGIARTFEAKAKEVGIKADSIPEYKELQKEILEGEELYRAIDRDYPTPKQL
tara:strand:- start:458 stop:841 length:384 start_codon:yes stop_codon:yes gene_type:complete